MKATIALFSMLLSTACFAQEEQQVIALSAEDAETCKAGGCQMVTKEALKAIAARLQRAQELEEIASRLAAELKKKPSRTYCL